MTLYIDSIGFHLLGRPHQVPKSSIDTEIKDQTLDDFLKNLNNEGREYITNAINTFPAIVWAEKVIPLGSIRRKNIINEIIPIIENGKIPDNMNYGKLIDSIGTPNKNYLELALFGLIKDIGEQELNS